MTIEQRLDRWELRQDALIASISGLTDVTVTTRDMLAELIKWLERPPSSDLPDVLRDLIEAVKGMQKAIERLPADVARAVTSGEIR